MGSFRDGSGKPWEASSNDLKGIEHWNGYTQEKFQRLLTIPFICCLTAHAHISVCRCCGILTSPPVLLHLPDGEGVWEKRFLVFFPRSLGERFEGQGWYWELANHIYHGWMDVFLSLSSVSKLTVCYFSAPAIKVSWRRIFCFYFSRIPYISITKSKVRNLGISNQDYPEDFYQDGKVN